MTDYRATIGLEIHAELKTETKMFCNSRNDVHASIPNTNICPVCLGHPGTLPTVNKEAVRQVLRVGVAVGGELADYTEFDRKNYFYPDIPKGYQISQYKYPLITGGSINGITLTRIHLEEDTARSQHDGTGSIIDFNRAGVPLMELVTEPVIHNAKEAADFARELQLLLRYLGASDANMEKGEMRIEANISVNVMGSEKLGTKVEVKNLNSFKSVENAIEYEVSRQISLIQKEEKVTQETRGWDDAKASTFSQRNKEDAHDYRYFPDPDIPKLRISEIDGFDEATLRNTLPELPWDLRKRFTEMYGLKDEDAEIYVQNSLYSAYFDRVATSLKSGQLLQKASNYFLTDLAGVHANEMSEEITIDPEYFARLIIMAQEGDISSRGAKLILEIMIREGGDPREIALRQNLLQRSDDSFIDDLVAQVLRENERAVKEYHEGKENALMYLVGQGMRFSQGSANPELLTKKLKQILDEM